MSSAKTHIATRDTLNDFMSFGHVIYSHGDGETITHPSRDTNPPYPPESIHNDEIEGDGWTLESGWTGQYGYNGPSMHASEYIGGRLAQYILETRGYWVALLSYTDCAVAGLDDCTGPQCESCDEPHGWGLAHYE